MPLGGGNEPEADMRLKKRDHNSEIISIKLLLNIKRWL